LVPARASLEARATELADPDLRDRVLAYVVADEEEDRALQEGSSDIDAFEAVRWATIRAYQDALKAVADARRRLDEA
jgi:hypothetical protein